MTSVHVGSPAERVLSGPGAAAGLPKEVERLGRSRVVVVSSATLAKQTPLIKNLELELGSRHRATFRGLPQHTPEAAVTELAHVLARQEADAVVSVGGGSVIDGCKAALHQAGASRSAVHLAIPTTLSGAEFTASAGVTDGPTNQKRSVVDREAAPRVVILDPLFALPTPLKLWLGSGIRAVDHAVETIWSPVQDELSNLLATEALRRLLTALPGCKRAPADAGARHQAQIAAWWAALGLASVPMGPSHSLGKLLGAPFGIPHGITSCALLPAVIEETAKTDPERVAPLAEPFQVAGPAEVARACRELIAQLELPTTLSQAGLSERDLPTYLESVPQEWREVVRATY
ncbi:MAG TPA: iron-containing alcohol dehydrogenase [Candidatus Dormibacteraeota bacterium]|nr:iron-containing alcohol dehydrogenase [Candidatus Dormibacteraeota bacterium]